MNAYNQESVRRSFRKNTDDTFSYNKLTKRLRCDADSFSAGDIEADTFTTSAISAPTDGDLALKTDDTARLTILSDGKIGINDSEPDENMIIKNASATDSASIKFVHSAFPDDRGCRIGKGLDGSFNITQLDARSMNLKTNSTARITVLSDGKIGINDSTPDENMIIKNA